MDQQIVLIGGQPEFNLVQIWDQSGLVETLPDLNEGRTGPACGQYMDDMYGQVILHFTNFLRLTRLLLNISTKSKKHKFTINVNTSN